MKADPTYDSPHDARFKVVVSVKLYRPVPKNFVRSFVPLESVERSFRVDDGAQFSRILDAVGKAVDAVLDTPPPPPPAKPA